MEKVVLKTDSETQAGNLEVNAQYVGRDINTTLGESLGLINVGRTVAPRRSLPPNPYSLNMLPGGAGGTLKI